MTDVHIKLESIGDAHRAKYAAFTKGKARMSKKNKEVDVAKSLMSRRPYVKRLTGLNSSGNFCGQMVKFKKDYSEATNDMGDRGVFYHYMLKDRTPYKIQQQISWKKTEIILVVPVDGVLIVLKNSEMKEFIKRTTQCPPLNSIRPGASWAFQPPE